METKNEISAGGILYKKILNPNSKILNISWLICQHSYHKGWVFPKGLIGDNQTDESIEHAALREVKEETGVNAAIIIPQPVEVVYTYHWNNSSHGKNDSHKYLVNKKVFYYLMEYISGDIDIHDSEMINVKFVSEKDVLASLTYPADKIAFEKILHLKKDIK